MLKPITLFVFLLYGVFCVFSVSSAQSSDVRTVVAGLTQDVSLLSQRVKELQLENEQIQLENKRLRSDIAKLSADRDAKSQIAELHASVAALRREFQAADAAQKQQIVTEVSKQIDALGKQTQSALNAMADTMKQAPSSPRTVEFSDDYPQTGRSYVVRGGDSLSKIARDHGSTVKFIQNANKIVDPSRDLRVGETIFIPIAE